MLLNRDQLQPVHDVNRDTPPPTPQFELTGQARHDIYPNHPDFPQTPIEMCHEWFELAGGYLRYIDVMGIMPIYQTDAQLHFMHEGGRAFWVVGTPFYAQNLYQGFVVRLLARHLGDAHPAVWQAGHTTISDELNAIAMGALPEILNLTHPETRSLFETGAILNWMRQFVHNWLGRDRILQVQLYNTCGAYLVMEYDQPRYMDRSGYYERYFGMIREDDLPDTRVRFLSCNWQGTLLMEALDRMVFTPLPYRRLMTPGRLPGRRIGELYPGEHPIPSDTDR
jgi:hypothetical protein